MKLHLTAVSEELLRCWLIINGNFSISFQLPGSGHRINGKLRVEQAGDQVNLELRAFDTTNTCTLPACQAITTLHAQAKRFIEDCANGQNLGVAA